MFLAAGDLIQIVTGSAVTTDVLAVLKDDGGNRKRQGYNLTTATTTTVATGSGGIAPNGINAVDYLGVRNKHASSSNLVTVNLVTTASGAAITVELGKYTLLAGETLRWMPGVGFSILDANGAIKASSNGTIVTRAVTATVTNSAAATPTEVTELRVTGTGTGTFQFQYNIIYQCTATTTGIMMSVNHTGTVGSGVYNMQWVDTSATAATGAPDQDVVAATGGVVSAMAYRALSATPAGPTASVDTADANMLMIVEGTVTVSVDGNLAFWFNTESGTLTSKVMAGSSLILTKVA